MLAELIVAFVMKAPDGNLFERLVHAFDLTVIRHDGLGALTSLLLHGGVALW